MKKTSVFIILAIILLALVFLVMSSGLKREEGEREVSGELKALELPGSSEISAELSDSNWEELDFSLEDDYLSPEIIDTNLEIIAPNPPLDTSEPSWKTPDGQEFSESFWIQ